MSGTLPDVRNLLHVYTPGALIAERYRLTSRIGSGGTGEVWRAVDIYGSSTPVAVKFLRCDVGPAAARRRFDSEVRSLVLLHAHRNVVRMLDCGEDAGRPFLVMEHLDLSLSSWLEEHRARRIYPPLATVCRLFQHVCEALAAAHRLADPGPITHRDINPQNIMMICNCDGEWVAKLLDFGVAKVGSRSLTWSCEPIGTPGYMPPEQACGEATPPCPASDVYSLGMLLAEMLTLYQPGQDQSTPEVATAPLSERIPMSLRPLRSDVPHAVWEVIGRCLKPELADRYADAGILGQAFAHALMWMRDPLPVPQQAECATHILCPQPAPLYEPAPLPTPMGVPTPLRLPLREKLRRLWQRFGAVLGPWLRTDAPSPQHGWQPEEPTALMWAASQGIAPAPAQPAHPRLRPAPLS